MTTNKHKFQGAVELKGKYLGESDDLGCINGKVYNIVAIQSFWNPDDVYAVVDETGEAYLYDRKLFEIIEEKQLVTV